MNINDTRSVKQKIIANTIYSSIGRFWLMGLSFLITPYIVKKLGIDRFGIWAIISVMTSYIGLFDLGFGTAFIKFVAEFTALGKQEEVNGLMSTGFIAFLLVFPLLALIIIGLAPLIIQLFDVPQPIYAEALFALRASVVVFAFSQIIGIFQAGVYGLQRMDLASKIMIGSSIMNFLITIVGLQLGYGLLALVMAGFASSLYVALISWRLLRRLLPQFKIVWHLFTRHHLRQLLGYGLRVQITNAAYLGITQVDRLLVGYFAGLGAVSNYTLGSTVTNTVRGIVSLPLAALMPAASELDAYADRNKLARLLERGSKYVALLVTPIAIFISLEAPLIMRVWLGPGFEQAAWVVRVLIVSHAVSIVVTGTGTAIARGMGQPGLETRATSAILLLMIGLGIPLTKYFGVPGILTSVVIALILPAIYFLRIICEKVGLPLRIFVKDTLIYPSLYTLVSSLALTAGHIFFADTSLQSGRLIGLLQLSIYSALFLTPYVLLLWKGPGIEREDRVAFRLFLHGISGQLRRILHRLPHAP